MATPIGTYLNKLKSNKARISRITGIPTTRLNAISNEDNTILYADELYKVIYIANRNAGIDEINFNKSIDEIFPQLKTINLLEELQDLSPVAKFFAKYTQKQNDIEKKLGMANGKISKYFNDKTKRAIALEILNFANGMNMDYLSVFKEIYGDISDLQEQ